MSAPVPLDVVRSWHSACADGNLKVATALLKTHGALLVNAAYQGQTGLILAILNNQQPILELLLSQENISPWTPTKERCST
jgi:ankyrin repeat protein